MKLCYSLTVIEDLMYAFPLGVATIFAFLILRKEIL